MPTPPRDEPTFGIEIFRRATTQILREQRSTPLQQTRWKPLATPTMHSPGATPLRWIDASETPHFKEIPCPSSQNSFLR